MENWPKFFFRSVCFERNGLNWCISWRNVIKEYACLVNNVYCVKRREYSSMIKVKGVGACVNKILLKQNPHNSVRTFPKNRDDFVKTLTPCWNRCFGWMLEYVSNNNKCYAIDSFVGFFFILVAGIRSLIIEWQILCEYKVECMVHNTNPVFCKHFSNSWCFIWFFFLHATYSGRDIQSTKKNKLVQHFSMN